MPPPRRAGDVRAGRADSCENVLGGALCRPLAIPGAHQRLPHDLARHRHPIVAEADGGGWGPEARKVFNELAKLTSTTTGEPEDIALGALYLASTASVQIAQSMCGPPGGGPVF